MDKQKLEEEKIALTKQYEVILININRYGGDEQLKKRMDKIVNRINEIKKILNTN